ncbi:hypothetical protein AX14_013208, partial [Amanita brunnescens Koide BX004]
MESNFASVVRFAPLERWQKLAGRHPVAKLHAKFWGISMLHEEQEWRNSQQPIPAVGDELETEDRMDMDFGVNAGCGSGDGWLEVRETRFEWNIVE